MLAQRHPSRGDVTLLNTTPPDIYGDFVVSIDLEINGFIYTASDVQFEIEVCCYYADFAFYIIGGISFGYLGIRAGYEDFELGFAYNGNSFTDPGFSYSTGDYSIDTTEDVTMWVAPVPIPGALWLLISGLGTVGAALLRSVPRQQP